MLVSITRRFEWDSGHRILNHESRCAHLHGHRYVGELAVSAEELDPLGRVIDFGVIKQLVGKWIDDNWDHNMLLHPEDPLLKALSIADRKTKMEGGAGDEVSKAVFGGKKPFVMLGIRGGDGKRKPSSLNPTVENIAAELFVRALSLLPNHIRPQRLRVYETPNCWADIDAHAHPQVGP